MHFFFLELSTTVLNDMIPLKKRLRQSKYNRVDFLPIDL